MLEMTSEQDQSNPTLGRLEWRANSGQTSNCATVADDASERTHHLSSYQLWRIGAWGGQLEQYQLGLRIAKIIWFDATIAFRLWSHAVYRT
jgi:hypothetical protein